MPESINGLIDRVTFHNPENGFAVLRVQIKGRADLVTVIGSTTSVTAGEHVEATGPWALVSCRQRHAVRRGSQSCVHAD
jgi:exodeoxyribonuclease V alpha subunit